jgi:hypothetical protein
MSYCSCGLYTIAFGDNSLFFLIGGSMASAIALAVGIGIDIAIRIRTKSKPIPKFDAAAEGHGEQWRLPARMWVACLRTEEPVSAKFGAEECYI